MNPLLSAIFALAIILPLPASAEQDCAALEKLPDKIHCENVAMDAVEKQLNDVYSELIQQLDKNQEETLREAQRGWVKYREANFAIGSALDASKGRLGLYTHLREMRLTTAHRIHELKQLLEASLAPPKERETYPTSATVQASSTSPEGAPKTKVKNAQTRATLLGTHELRLQWLSSERPGTVAIRDIDGIVMLQGQQSGESGEILISGRVDKILTNSFTLKGTITSRTSFLNEGKPCQRTGTHWFSRKHGRPFWRLQAITNPCTGVIDYVDIFVRNNEK